MLLIACAVALAVNLLFTEESILAARSNATVAIVTKKFLKGIPQLFEYYFVYSRSNLIQ